MNAGGWHGGAPHWNGGSGRTALVRSGIALALAGMAAVVIGTAAGMAAVGNIMIITVAGGELVPLEVSVLALDYSGERSQRLPITAAMTIATITPLMPVRLDLRFGIGAIPISGLLPCDTRMPGSLARSCSVTGWKSRSRFADFRKCRARLDRCAPAPRDWLSSGMPLRQRARSYGTPLSSRPTVGPPRLPASSNGALRSRTVACVPCNGTSEPIRLLNAA